MIDDVLNFNREFVKNKGYEKYITNKFPDKKIAIVTCMDTRLTELLPAALGFKNGDVKVIKNAGGIISHPFGSAIRSLLVAIYELGVNDIMIIGHTDCGAQQLDSERIVRNMKSRGISDDSLQMMRYCGLHIDTWLSGFSDVESAVCKTVELVKHHPLIPSDVIVHGFVIDSVTGQLTRVS